MRAGTVKAGPPAVCPTCHARIIWVRCRDGRNFPLDAEPVPEGRWLVEDGYALPAASRRVPLARYMSHYATCVDSKNRRPGG